MTEQDLIQFEEEIKEIYLTGAIHGPIHLSGGNEAELIDIFRKINPEDWVFSTYRSHYHALLKGVPREVVKAEILAGRSIHLNFKEYNFMSSAIVGGCLPIAVGVAMAIKRKGEQRRVWCFVGDMAAESGVFYECTKYAARHGLPMVFIDEDNGLSVNTPTQEVWGPGILEKPEILHYIYSRKHPHIGCGVWVIFS